MSAAALLAELRGLGVTIGADGDRLTVEAPAGVLTLARLDRLRMHKHLILAYLAADESVVAWRVAAMRAQLPAGGPVPFLTVRGTQRGPTAARAAATP